MPNINPKRLLLYFGIAVFVILIIALFFDFIIMPWYTKHGEALAVPNVIAKRFEAAKELLELQDLEVVKQGEKYDPHLPFGYVVDQNPRPNRLVKKGRRIYLTISVGEREIQVPNLIGLSETNAEEVLKSIGLRLGEREYKYVQNGLPKEVIEQSVKQNTYVKESTIIEITVSLGQPVENVKVPFVIGKTLERAKREIQKSGLTVGRVNYQLNNYLVPNTVIEQSLDAGLNVANGDTVDLIVSTIKKSEIQ